MNNAVTLLPAVEQSVRVGLAPRDAFDLFTRQIARWWPFAGHSCFDAEARDVVFEPRIGGAVTELAHDGRRMMWGTLTAWSPPSGFSMRWFPGLDEAQATLLEVRFVALQMGGTEVRVRHSGWEARGGEAQGKRDAYGSGWAAVLQLYAQCASRSAS
jgi:uncharacterized protein YndB with AHSA1/START domain